MKLHEKSRRTLELTSDPVLEVALEPVVLRAEPKKVKLLGMTLATVTDELRDAYDLSDASGVLILDPGKNPARLEIGMIHEGDRFWCVGDQDVKTLEDFANGLLAEA